MTNSFRRDWRDVSSTYGRDTSFHSAGLNLYPVRDARLLGGLSITYQWGEDPSEKYRPQAYVQYGLALRVKGGA